MVEELGVYGRRRQLEGGHAGRAGAVGRLAPRRGHLAVATGVPRVQETLTDKVSLLEKGQEWVENRLSTGTLLTSARVTGAIIDRRQSHQCLTEWCPID